MAFDIRMFKIVTGEIIIGKYNEKNNSVDEVAIIQTVPSEQSMQMLILPYGYPFESKFVGSISGQFLVFQYSQTPEELQNKYTETVTNLTISGGLGKLNFSDNKPSGLIK